MGWPADWVYHSTFGDGWEEKTPRKLDGSRTTRSSSSI
jgi:hypothetical protein